MRPSGGKRSHGVICPKAAGISRDLCQSARGLRRVGRRRRPSLPGGISCHSGSDREASINLCGITTNQPIPTARISTSSLLKPVWAPRPPADRVLPGSAFARSEYRRLPPPPARWRKYSGQSPARSVIPHLGQVRYPHIPCCHTYQYPGTTLTRYPSIINDSEPGYADARLHHPHLSNATTGIGGRGFARWLPTQPEGIAYPATHTPYGLTHWPQKRRFPDVGTWQFSKHHNAFLTVRRLPYALHRANGTVPAVSICGSRLPNARQWREGISRGPP